VCVCVCVCVCACVSSGVSMILNIDAALKADVSARLDI